MASFSVTPQNQADIAGLYVAFWNRAPDTSGFAFWVDKLASGQATIDEIATEMRFKPEGTAAYPLWSTNSALIIEVYNHVFGRAPDDEGYDFWLSKLDAGLPFPELVVAMCQAAVANGSDDGALFINKVDVGVYVATVAQVDGGYVCDQAFNLVTADPASVDTAINWVDANNTGDVYTLTTDIDSIDVVGQKMNTVTGLQEATASQTWNTGDTINGNGLTRVNLVAKGGTPSIVDVNDVASVNINLISNTTLDTVEFSNVGQILVTSGVVLSEGSGNLTVLNANQTTVHGFASTGRTFSQTITYTDTSGTADVAALLMAGTGTSTNRSSFHVDNSNAIEAVTLATSGTNYVTLNAGTGAAKFTITSSGNNNILFGSGAAARLIDASATTGINTLNLGTQLSSGDTIIGGAAAADTLVADLASGLQILPTVSGVETLNLEFNAAAILNASKITGATHLNIAGSTANASVTNLANSTNTLGSSISNAGTVSVSYLTGAAADVTYNLGGSAAVSNAATTFANIDSLAINASGESISATGDLTLGAAATSLVVNSATATNDLTIGAVSGAGLQTIAINANGGDVVLGDVNSKTDGSELRALTVVATGGANVTVGNIDANSADASAFSSLSVEMGNDSTLTVGNIDGLVGKNTMDTYNIVLGDNIGYSTVGTVTADTIASVNVTVGANSADSGTRLVLGGLHVSDVGDINLSVGKNNTVDLYVDAGSSPYSMGIVTGSGEGNVTFRAYGNAPEMTRTVDMTLLSGSSDARFYYVNSGSPGVLMLGGSGTDVFWGSSVDDVIAGNDGNDTLLGEDGADDIQGGAGDDTINGGDGPDVIDGGLGNNTVTYESSFPIVVNLETNVNTGGYAQGDNLINIQNVVGTMGSDSLTGDEAVNLLRGREGNDTINGNAGNDILTGDVGADDFLMSNIVNTAGSASTYTVTDFSTVDDQIGNFSVSNLESWVSAPNIVKWQNAANQAAGVVVTATITGATDLASITAGANVLVLDGTFANAAAVTAALASGGAFQLTVNNTWNADSAALVVWDDGTNTYISQLMTNQSVADNGQFNNSGHLLFNQMAVLQGVTDATTVTNYLAFLA